MRYFCGVCKTKKLPTSFPARDAKVCSACEMELKTPPALADDPPPAPKAVKTPSLRIKSLPVEPVVPPAAPDVLSAPPEASAGEVFVSPDPEINPADPSDREKAARVLAGRRLLPFIKRFRPKYDAGWVHEDICRRLERFVKDVEEGKEPRLLLAMPVRHGKSEIGSRHFAPWVMGKHPDWEIIAASGAQSLAMSFSRYIRDLVRDPAYQSIFPSMKLDPSSQSVENWNTLSGGGYLAAGIGTMITGRGCHILLLDDPVKDAEAADSRVIRDATWEWYMSTAVTRLAPGGGVLGIMTFWHDDDWAGRIQQVMATGDGDKFEIVKYPAINEAGDEYILADDSIVQLPPGSTVPSDARMTRPRNTALHPARYTLEALLRRKANYHALGQQRWWNALYQQNPAAEEGAYFRKEWFQGYGTAPRRIDCTVYQAWDFAITEKALSDYTVGVTIMQDANDNLSVVDVRRFKMGDGDELMRIVVSYAKEFMPDLIGFEDGQIWKALASTFTKTCQENSYYPAYEVLQPLTDKMVRAQPLRGRMQARKIWFDKSAHWYNDLQQEFLRFPTGKHDDMIDSTAWCVRLTLSKSAPKPPAPPVLKGWKDRLGAMMAGADASHMAS